MSTTNENKSVLQASESEDLHESNKALSSCSKIASPDKSAVDLLASESEDLHETSKALSSCSKLTSPDKSLLDLQASDSEDLHQRSKALSSPSKLLSQDKSSVENKSSIVASVSEDVFEKKNNVLSPSLLSMPPKVVLNSRDVLWVTTLSNNIRQEDGIHITFRTDVKVFSLSKTKLETRLLAKSESIEKEKHDYILTGQHNMIYTGKQAFVCDSATGIVSPGTLRYLGDNNDCTKLWQLNLLKIRANLIMSTNKMKEIFYRDGKTRSYYKLWIGRVYFTDMKLHREKINKL